MTSTAPAPGSDTAVQTTPEATGVTVGLSTRVVSWVVDFLLINVVATITGAAVALVVQLFPIADNLQPIFIAIGGCVYIAWTAAYFVVFWSMTGQTPGARLMQVRLVTPEGGSVKPVRAFVRWIGMNLGLLPVPWGYVPIPFRRLGFPDWLAHTRVIEAPQRSLAAARLDKVRQARERARTAAPPVSRERDG
jgi:uncharacterized RDD family membrane protein YckC